VKRVRIINLCLAGTYKTDLHAPQASGFAKDYLRAVVDEIRIEGNAATFSGSYEQLIAAMAKEKEDTALVPSFMRDWRPDGDSNPGYRRERAMS